MPPRRQNQNQREPEESVNNEGGPADPMQTFVDMLAEAMQNRTPVMVNLPTNHLANFKDFRTVGPPEFKGTTDPIEAQSWVKEMEKAFIVARVAEEQKTAFATYMMKGEANYWWEANQSRAGEGVVAWSRFKELFFENYFPRSMQSKMEIRFLNLKQENMSVAEYASKFNELARFAPHQVDTEERKARRFKQGLKPGLYSKVSVLQIDSFATILEKSSIAEGGSEAMTKYSQDQKRKRSDGGNRKGSSGGSNSSKRKWNSNNGSPGNTKGVDLRRGEKCSNCGRHHSGECRKGTNVCYNCGQEGHIAPNCLKPKRSRGCFACGNTDHQVKNCPIKGNGGGSGNRSSNNKLTMGGPVQPNKSTT